MRKIIARKVTRDGTVELSVHNYTRTPADLMLYLISGDDASGADQPPDFTDAFGDEFNKVWKITIEPESHWRVHYPGQGGGSLDLRGVDEKMKVVVDLDVQ